MAEQPNIPETLKKLVVPIAGLKHYDKNARQGDLDAIIDSLSMHGQYRPVVVRTGTMEILAGNHTVMAAREMGWEEIAATFVTCDDDEAARIVLVDNRTNDLGGYDDEALAELLQSLDGNLEGTGFEQDDLDALLASLDNVDIGDEDLDDVLEEGDEAAWPVIRVQIQPELAARFRDIDGETDEERFMRLMQKAGV